MADVIKKSGVIYGKDVYDLFKYAQAKQFAIPAINVTSSSTAVAALEAARDNKSPIILQLSQGGAAYFAGKGISNSNQEASIGGAVAAAHYIRGVAPLYGIPVILHTDHCAKKLAPWLKGMLEEDYKVFKQTGTPLYSSHMIDYSEEPVEDNIAACEKLLGSEGKMAEMNQFLEMEIGITGGEEDGVQHDTRSPNLYTQPENIHEIYQRLTKFQGKSPSGPFNLFTIAAGFGNVHGVYSPGNVKLEPKLLKDHQAYVKDHEKLSDDKPVFLVFHGGSGSGVEEFREAIGYGVVKVNLDTDMQWAYTTGIRDYMRKNAERLNKQVGFKYLDENKVEREDTSTPNKKLYDPRVWVRDGEKTMSKRVAEALKDFNTAGQVH